MPRSPGCRDAKGDGKADILWREAASGRVAALATDVAPHWVGGLIDWGTGRVAAQAPAADTIEVGDLYAKFFRQLMAWTANL